MVKPKERVDIIFQHYVLLFEELILDVFYRPVLSASRTACSALWIASEDLSLLIQEALMLRLAS